MGIYNMKWRVVRTHQSSRPHAGIICFQTRGHKGGGKRAIRHPGDVVRGGNRPLNVCVCVCVCWDR